MESSKRSTPRAKSSSTTSPATKPTPTSSRTTSTSSTITSVVIALGSNLGDRAWHLRRALHELAPFVRIVRISTVHETKAVDAPVGSPDFLNMVVVGHTRLEPLELLHAMQTLETKLGRRRSGVRNEPRVVDLDLIFYGALRMRTGELTLPHPRWATRAFVVEPLREVWCGLSAHTTPGW